MTLSTLLGGLSVVIQKMALHTLQPDVVAFFRSLVIFVTIGIFILFQQKHMTALFHLEPKQLFYLIVIGILSATVLVLYLYALRQGKASSVAGFDNLTFVFTAIFAVLLLGERLTIPSVIGMILILGGVFLMSV